jgi:hypothetical protein
MDRFKNFTGLLAVVGIILAGCGGDEESRSTGEGAPSEALEIASVSSCYAIVGESTSLTLQGGGFQEGAAVFFGQENGEEFGVADESAISVETATVSSPETIDLTVTCHVEGSFAIAVQNSGGTSDSIDGVFQCSSGAVDCSAEPASPDPASLLDQITGILDQLVENATETLNVTPVIAAYSPETATAGEAVSVWGTILEGFEVQVVGPCGDPQSVTRYEPLLSNVLAKFNMPDFDACGEAGDTFPVAVQFLNQGVVVPLGGKGEGDSLYINYYIPEPEPAPTVEITEYSPASGTSGDTVVVKANTGLKDLSVTVFLEGGASFSVERQESSLWSNIMAQFTVPSFDDYGDPFDTLDVRIKFTTAEEGPVSLVHNGGTVGSLGFNYIVPLNPADVFVAIDILDVLDEVMNPEEPEIPDVEQVIQTVVDILKDKNPAEEEEEGITPVLIIPDFEGVVRAIDEEKTLSPEDLLDKIQKVEKIFTPSAEDVFKKVVDIFNKLFPPDEERITPVLLIPDLEGIVRAIDDGTLSPQDLLDRLRKVERIFGPSAEEILGKIVDILNKLFPTEETVTPILLIPDFEGVIRAIGENNEESLDPTELLENLRKVEKIFTPDPNELVGTAVDIFNKLSPEEEKPIVPVLIVPDLDQAMNSLDLVEINPVDILESLDIGDLLSEVFDEEDSTSPVLVIDVTGSVNVLKTAPTE